MPLILIAEDEIPCAKKWCRATIAMDGHVTVIAEDGAEAREIPHPRTWSVRMLLTDSRCR